MGVGDQHHAPAASYPGKDPIPPVKGAGLQGPRAGLDGLKISSPPEFDAGPSCP